MIFIRWPSFVHSNFGRVVVRTPLDLADFTVLALLADASFRMPLGFCDGGVGSTSTIRFFFFSSACARTACAAGNSEIGIRAVRGASFPFDAMFGVLMLRDSATECWASMRCKPSSSRAKCQHTSGKMPKRLCVPMRNARKAGSRRVRDFSDELYTQSNTADALPAATRGCQGHVYQRGRQQQSDRKRRECEPGNQGQGSRRSSTLWAERQLSPPLSTENLSSVYGTPSGR